MERFFIRIIYLAIIIAIPLTATRTQAAGVSPDVALSHFAADYGIGDAVADFRLKSVEGRTVSLSDFSGQKGVIIIFTCNHCPFF